MKIVLVCMYYDYGDSSRGVSYEYNTYHAPLVNMGHEVVLFDFMSELKAHGKAAMNQRLLDLVKREQPDAAVFALYKDEFEFDTLESLRQYTKTFCFFQDDTWRVDYTLTWGPHFDLFGTPDPFGVERYKARGIENVMHVPFGANEFVFKRQECEKEYDVSFVGVKHPYRDWIVKRLEAEGIKVATFGRKWDNGRVTVEQMVEVFNKSKINLNLSNSISYDIRYLFSSLRALHDFTKNRKRIEQQKARPFEVCGAGGFLLTYYVSGLEKYYRVGEDLAIYTSPDGLVEQVKYYLAHDSERQQIAENGYQRTLQQHTFSKRFEDIFKTLF